MAENRTSGIIASIIGLFDTGLATLRNRLELFSVELREEKCRLVEVIVLAGAMMALGVMALTLLTLTVVLLFSESNRPAAMIVVSVVYLSATIVLARVLRARLKAWVSFSGTLEEIKKDQACLANWQSSDPANKSS